MWPPLKRAAGSEWASTPNKQIKRYQRHCWPLVQCFSRRGTLQYSANAGTITSYPRETPGNSETIIRSRDRRRTLRKNCAQLARESLDFCSRSPRVSFLLFPTSRAVSLYEEEICFDRYFEDKYEKNKFPNDGKCSTAFEETKSTSEDFKDQGRAAMLNRFIWKNTNYICAIKLLCPTLFFAAGWHFDINFFTVSIYQY